MAPGPPGAMANGVKAGCCQPTIHDNADLDLKLTNLIELFAPNINPGRMIDRSM
jgi:hypothetical protein